MSEQWRQERPTWCPHTDCAFKRRAQDAVCGGELPTPILHDGAPNTHRLCLNGAADNGGVLDLQVNATDLEYFRWIFDALDGKTTSWLSRAGPDRAAIRAVVLAAMGQQASEPLASAIVERLCVAPSTSNVTWEEVRPLLFSTGGPSANHSVKKGDRTGLEPATPAFYSVTPDSGATAADSRLSPSDVSGGALPSELPATDEQYSGEPSAVPREPDGWIVVMGDGSFGPAHSTQEQADETAKAAAAMFQSVARPGEVHTRPFVYIGTRDVQWITDECDGGVHSRCESDDCHCDCHARPADGGEPTREANDG